MVYTWLIYGQYMVYIWCSKSLGYTWEKSEGIMTNQWDIFSWTINMRLLYMLYTWEIHYLGNLMIEHLITCTKLY
jgi:hypothetical protein